MATKEIKFEIVEHIGVITKTDTYMKALNRVSWNGRKPAYDLRSWKLGDDGTEEAPLKGISLSQEDILALKDLLNDLEV